MGATNVAPENGRLRNGILTSDETRSDCIADLGDALGRENSWSLTRLEVARVASAEQEAQCGDGSDAGGPAARGLFGSFVGRFGIFGARHLPFGTAFLSSSGFALAAVLLIVLLEKSYSDFGYHFQASTAVRERGSQAPAFNRCRCRKLQRVVKNIAMRLPGSQSSNASLAGICTAMAKACYAAAISSRETARVRPIRGSRLARSGPLSSPVRASRSGISIS